jgi:hypothetical protein
MWTTLTTAQYEKDFIHYDKKRPNELSAVVDNLSRYLKMLEASTNSKAVKAGFLHPEPLDIVAIDQKGGGPNLQQTRLYTYADDANKKLYLITIGGKKNQSGDIKFCTDFVKSITQSNT